MLVDSRFESVLKLIIDFMFLLPSLLTRIVLIGYVYINGDDACALHHYLIEEHHNNKNVMSGERRTSYTLLSDLM